VINARSVIAGVAPPNDGCGNATAIAPLPYVDTVLTTAATTDATDPTPMCPIDSPNPRGKSVWYVFDATAAGTLVADTFESDYDTILSVYSGNCGALQPVPDACSDDDPLDGAQSRVTLAVSPGSTYRLMASAFHDDGGNLTFHAVFSGADTASPTVSRTPTATRTATSGVLQTATASRAPSAVMTVTPTRSGTVVGTPLATPTRTATANLSGDANCDGRISAADLTAVITLIAAAARAPCGLDDANEDGVLDLADITTIVHVIFAR
jgi:hypothetical protein